MLNNCFAIELHMSITWLKTEDALKEMGEKLLLDNLFSSQSHPTKGTESQIRDDGLLTNNMTMFLWLSQPNENLMDGIEKERNVLRK